MFVYILGFFFYGVSRADLHNKYKSNFVYLNNLRLSIKVILEVYAKGWPECARISKQKLRTIP